MAEEGETLEAGVTVAEREMFLGCKNISKLCSALSQYYQYKIIPFQNKENI